MMFNFLVIVPLESKSLKRKIYLHMCLIFSRMPRFQVDGPRKIIASLSRVCQPTLMLMKVKNKMNKERVHKSRNSPLFHVI